MVPWTPDGLHVWCCQEFGNRGVARAAAGQQTCPRVREGSHCAALCHCNVLISSHWQLDLQPTDRLLDVGCGWGTLAAFAAKNYGCEVVGITLGKNQTKFGNDRIAANVRAAPVLEES